MPTDFVQEAADLAFRLAVYRAMKEGAHWLRTRLALLEAEGRDWWACDPHPKRDLDEPQQRLPLGGPA